MAGTTAAFELSTSWQQISSSADAPVTIFQETDVDVALYYGDEAPTAQSPFATLKFAHRNAVGFGTPTAAIWLRAVDQTAQVTVLKG